MLPISVTYSEGVFLTLVIEHAMRMCRIVLSVACLVLPILGAFAVLRKATISFVMSVSPSVRKSVRNNSAPTGPIFMKLLILVFLENLSRNVMFH